MCFSATNCIARGRSRRAISGSVTWRLTVASSGSAMRTRRLAIVARASVCRTASPR
jgi:hypothetical protein